MSSWPSDAEALIAAQLQLASAHPEPWLPAGDLQSIAACFVCWPRGEAGGGAGAAGDAGWAAAAWMWGREVAAVATATGRAGAPYIPGLLALREGPLLEAALLALRRDPWLQVAGLGLRATSPPDAAGLALAAIPGIDVLLVNATGRDHPRRAGLALHLGARLGLPTVGVTNRPLLAEGEWPSDTRGATSALRLGGDTVAFWVRTRRGTRPLVAHAGWRTDAQTAAEVLLAASHPARTPEPLRRARRAARAARTGTLQEHSA